MGQFRDRMDEELRIRGYSANTRECYVRCVRNFVRHVMRPPDQLTLEHIRQYVLPQEGMRPGYAASPRTILTREACLRGRCWRTRRTADI